MSIRDLITSGDLSVAQSILYGERLRLAFEDVWRRHQSQAGSAWQARRARLYLSINGEKPNGGAETNSRETIGRLVRESGCSPKIARAIADALGVDWKHARNTANLTLAVSD